jgi:hypothetical protein
MEKIREIVCDELGRVGRKVEQVAPIRGEILFTGEEGLAELFQEFSLLAVAPAYSILCILGQRRHNQ